MTIDAARGRLAATADLSAADAALVGLVHPADWRNPKAAAAYDLVVLGAGTAGLVSAMGAAGLGARVALIERHLLGGDCLNTGCVPSKALLRSARVVGELRRAAGLGVIAGPALVQISGGHAAHAPAARVDRGARCRGPADASRRRRLLRSGTVRRRTVDGRRRPAPALQSSGHRDRRETGPAADCRSRRHAASTPARRSSP